MDNYDNLLSFMNQIQPSQRNTIEDRTSDYNNQLASLAQIGDNRLYQPQYEQPVQQPTPTPTYNQAKVLQASTKLADFINTNKSGGRLNKNSLPSFPNSTPLASRQIADPKILQLIKKYFPPNQWANAVAIMNAESGGRPEAVGDNYPINGLLAPSYGLFQIRGLPGRPAPTQLLDPDFNVRYAAQMQQQQTWSPWSTAKKLGLL